MSPNSCAEVLTFRTPEYRWHDVILEQGGPRSRTAVSLWTGGIWTDTGGKVSSGHKGRKYVLGGMLLQGRDHPWWSGNFPELSQEPADPWVWVLAQNQREESAVVSRHPV